MKAKKTISSEIEKLKNLHGRERLQYIWDYYKLPLVVLCAIIYVIGYIIHAQVTYKDTMLCTALVNVSAGEELDTQLSSGYLDFLEEDSAKNEVVLMSGLYLTDDESDTNYQYVYATQVKILASINSQEMDVVLMNQEAFDTFSRNGYLCDLEKLLSDTDPDLYHELASYLIDNTSVNLSHAPLIRQANLNDTVYLGIIENSQRKDMAVKYIKYLFSAGNNVSSRNDPKSA